MLTLTSRLMPNEGEVASSVLDGEAIMINLSNGVYYSMDAVGGWVWEQITAQHTLGEILEAILQQYEVSREQAWSDLERLAGELLSENLVMTSNAGAEVQPNLSRVARSRLPYTPPRLEIYRDLGDLLAIDPPMPALKEIVWSKAGEDNAL